MNCGFDTAEYKLRLENLQRGMQQQDIDVALFCSEAEIRYFSGFATQFWQSPTRPWFLLVPQQGELIAIIPSIGEPLMQRTWVNDIRSWQSPDPADEGVSLLSDSLLECTGGQATVGLMKGPETLLRMPLSDYEKLLQLTPTLRYTDISNLIQSQRQVKSASEIDKIRHAATAASMAFSQLPDKLNTGMTERDIFRRFMHLCLDAGADDVSYLVGAVRAGGYDDIIAPAGDHVSADGDILILDTGCVYDGYFCDFDRNFAFGSTDKLTADAYLRTHESIDAALAMVKAGVTCAELYATMNSVLCSEDNLVGRMGHGLGLQLTETPSVTPSDHTVLQAGMVITLEPTFNYGRGKVMVHEENLVVLDSGYELLSQRAPSEIPVI